MRIIAMQEIARAGLRRRRRGLFSHTIGAPPILHRGSEEMKARVLPQILSGEKICAPPGSPNPAAAPTSPTCAPPPGAMAIISWSTDRRRSSRRASAPISSRSPAAPADPAPPRQPVLIEGQPEGLQRTPLKKMGWWCSDTATLYFENVRVPASNLIGKEGEGSAPSCSISTTSACTARRGPFRAARVCLEEGRTAYARQRETFGKPLIQHQVIRHKLVDMAMKVEASQAMLELLTWRLENGTIRSRKSAC